MYLFHITGLEVFTAVFVKISVLVNITPVSLLEVKKCFGAISYLHLLLETYFRLVSYLGCVSTLKLEALYVASCAVFCLIVMCYFVLHVYFRVFCLVVPLPPGKPHFQFN
jgi:hypothetical protein